MPHHEAPTDLRAYVAMKGPSAQILLSPKTAALGFVPKPERPQPSVIQVRRGPVYRAAGRLLPQPPKDALKPALRKAGLLPPDTTPPSQRRR